MTPTPSGKSPNVIEFPAILTKMVMHFVFSFVFCGVGGGGGVISLFKKQAQINKSFFVTVNSI